MLDDAAPEVHGRYSRQTDCEDSEEDCQAAKIAVKKQLIKIFELQKELEKEVVPFAYDAYKYFDFVCLAKASANYVAFLKGQITNHILATGDGECKELARNNFCASNCSGFIVSYGGGCRRETPQDITSCDDQANFNEEVFAIVRERLQIATAEGELRSFNCDIC